MMHLLYSQHANRLGRPLRKCKHLWDPLCRPTASSYYRLGYICGKSTYIVAVTIQPFAVLWRQKIWSHYSARSLDRTAESIGLSLLLTTSKERLTLQMVHRDIQLQIIPNLTNMICPRNIETAAKKIRSDNTRSNTTPRHRPPCDLQTHNAWGCYEAAANGITPINLPERTSGRRNCLGRQSGATRGWVVLTKIAWTVQVPLGLAEPGAIPCRTLWGCHFE
jgi:hypothetical protein